MGLWLGLGAGGAARYLALLIRAELTYPEVGVTRDGTTPPGYRVLDQSDVVGHGRAAFDALTTGLLCWDLQRGAGLQVSASSPVVAPGITVVNALAAGPLRLLVPCRVLYLVDEPTVRGFGYGTLPGHPLTGEERFTVELRPDDDVVLRIRSFSRAAGLARLGGPITRAGQDLVNRRYVHAARAIIGS